MNTVRQVTDATFASEVLKSPTPVLIDFYARWCGPCRWMAPVIDEMAREYTGRLKVVKIDVEESQETAAAFGIDAMPTFVLLKGGQEAYRRVGAAPKSFLSEELEKVI